MGNTAALDNDVVELLNLALGAAEGAEALLGQLAVLGVDACGLEQGHIDGVAEFVDLCDRYGMTNDDISATSPILK